MQDKPQTPDAPAATETLPTDHDLAAITAPAIARPRSASTAPLAQKPSVGRIVHYLHEVSHKSASDELPDTVELVPHAAMIVKVWSDACVNLQVFNDGDPDDLGGNLVLKTSVTLGTSAGSWCWPPRV